jgi:hypothetical protein
MELHSVQLPQGVLLSIISKQIRNMELIGIIRIIERSMLKVWLLLLLFVIQRMNRIQMNTMMNILSCSMNGIILAILETC